MFATVCRCLDTVPDMCLARSDTMESTTFSMKELSTLTGMPMRTVRYYIQIGLAPRPVGEGRGAYYTDEHLERLLHIRKLTRGGLSLEAIRQTIEAEDTPQVVLHRPKPGETSVRSHVHIQQGIEIVIDPKEAAISPEQLRHLIAGVLELAAQGVNQNRGTPLPQTP
jgi:DNA-binding transcriptional MerR regulator